MASETPSRLEFNNVISMGVSYSWEHIAGENAANSCEGVSEEEKSNLIKRTKNVSLDLLNLDLGNADNSVIQFMANNQSQYMAGNLVDIYANGIYAGNGKLSNYSIKEGSQSNSVVTNLNYEMKNGGPDDSQNFDTAENPVQRTESINVSRDIKSSSYKIQHNYSISFGDDFNMVTDHPLYAEDPNYKSVDARLVLGENEANQKFLNPVDYSDYIDLSGYAVEAGWDMKKLKNNCMGAFETSSETKDYINGNYSKTITKEIRYTGENIDSDNTDPYEIEYSMSFNIEDRNGKSCAIAKMDGNVKSTASSNGGCSATNTADAAQSGFDEFVTNGTAKERLTQWFQQMSSFAGSNQTLTPVMKDLKKTTCMPSVDRGQNQNNGQIGFSFQMDNCPSEKITENGAPYSSSESFNISFSEAKNCDDVEVSVTNSSISKSVQGKCGLQINAAGQYPRFNSIASIPGPGQPAYEGSRPADNKIKSSSYSYSPYQASKSWSYSYSDAINTDDCKERTDDDCYSFSVSENVSSPTPRVVEELTCAGFVSQEQGTNKGKKTASITLEVKQDDCDMNLNALKSELKEKMQESAPNCLITELSWSYSVNKGSAPSMQANIGGID